MIDITAIVEAYPKRSGGQGWTPAKRLIQGHLANGVSYDDILEGTKAYAKWCNYSGKTGTELVKQARTFFGRDCWWEEDYSIPDTTYKQYEPAPVTEEQRVKDREAFEADMKRLRVIK